MALPATVEAPRRLLPDIAQLLAPFPGRLEFALRVALICALTTLVAEIYQTPEPALTAYVVFFLNKPDRVESTVLAIAFLIIITLVIGLVFLAANIVIDEPALRVTAMTLISFVLLFLASSSKLKPLAGIIALIVAYALDLLGGVPVSEVATRALFYAWLFVGIPASVSIVINLLIAPAPRRLAERALAERLERAAELLEAPSARTHAAFAEALNEGMMEIGTWLKLAGLEHTSSAEDINALKQAAASTTEILLLVDMIDRDAPTFPPALRESVAETLEDMAAILRAGGYPEDISLDASEEEASLSSLDRTIFERLKAAVTGFCEVPAGPAPTLAKKAKGGFFLPDAFTNVDHVRYALKTTGAAMFCYLVYSQLDWSGIHTALITCYIVSLGTAAETIEKLTLRIVGCMVGAAVGILTLVFVIPHLTTIGALMILVFVGALPGRGFRGGARAFLISASNSPSPFSSASSRARNPASTWSWRATASSAYCSAISSSIFFSPMSGLSSVSSRIDHAIASLLRHLSALALAGNLTARRALAAQVQADLGGLERDLALVPYEPAAIRPDAIGSKRAVAPQAKSRHSKRPSCFILAMAPRGSPASSMRSQTI